MELKGGGGGAGGSQVASAGGSGGGANSNNSYQAAAGSGLGLANAGGNGATNNVHWWGGGGGGAMSAGGAASSTDNLSNPGSGGAGFVTNITGVNRCFAAGGGGGRTWIASSVGGTGGPCTSGQVNATVSTTGGAGSPDNIVAGSGQVNSGSGGGGGGLVQSGELWGNSGSGGSGVVILSYGPYLQVTRSPVAARVGSSFTNSIQVQFTNLDGSLFSSNSPVTVTSSAALILNGVPLTQSLTVNAVNGIATFAGLGFASSVTSAQTLTFTSDAFVGTSVTITPTFFANNLVINSSNSSTGFMLGGEFYASSSAGVSFLNVADLHANAVANTISISVSGSISISSAVNISISGRSLTFRAGADIHVANVNVLTQGPLNFFSDADGSGSGSFNSDTSSLVNSQGGRVVISGGLDPTTGYAVGSSNSQWSGARILGDLWSGGGDIIIRGDSGAGINTAEVTAPNWTAGVLLGAKTVDAGSGAISISGAVNRNADNTEIHYGVSIGTNDATVNGVVRTTTGGISIRVDSSPTTGANKEGFGLMRADVLSDTGVITISAVASATANEIDVNTSRNSRISTSGSITVEGRGPGTEYLGSLVLSSPNAIVIRGDRPDINSGFVFTSSPVVTLESFGASFSATVATTNLTVGSATRGLRIGKTTNTSAVTLGSSMTVNGPIEVYGSDISLTNKPSLVVSSQSARLLLRATRNIDVAAGTATNDRSLLQTNMGDLILWVNSTNGGSGYLYLGNFAVLNSA
ncbi:MAG: hypothetical protein EBS38_07875, partial [Actinobacteria bacterium]|nr:hypothetical protein [Actinomycetota bacterium]